MQHDDENFLGIDAGGYSLLRIFMKAFDTQKFDALDAEPIVNTMVCIFVLIVNVFLTSLFIAQLSCSYSSVFEDMQGYARLERSKIIVEMMPSVPKARWYKFVSDMKFTQRLEFNPGDIGLAGGIQVKEPASLHPTTEDSIRRFGGSTSPDAQWPAEDE